MHLAVLDGWIDQATFTPAFFMFWANSDEYMFFLPHRKTQYAEATPAAIFESFKQFTQKPNRLVQGKYPDLSHGA